MKRFKYFGFVLLALIFLVQSCTVEKRVHQRGYHVEWRKAKKTSTRITQTDPNKNTQEFLASEEVQPNVREVNSADSYQTEQNNFETEDRFNNVDDNLEYSQNDNEECDIIILSNGDEISAKVLEVGTYEIKYLKCDNLEGPSFTIRRSTVFMIRHANGTKTLINDQTQVEEEENEITEDDYIKTIHTDDKSFLMAVALWFFLGIIGIHRFYLGHIGIGVLYLLTAGLCGIGWLIDGIMFATGSLQPADGEYIDD